MASFIDQIRSAFIDIENLFETLPNDIREMAGPVTAWRTNERREKRFLVCRGLRPDHYLLDIGCGPLRGGLPLIAYLKPGRYFGFDIAPESIEIAKRRVEKRGLRGRRATLWASSIDAVPEHILGSDRRFDYILAFSVFIHLDDVRLARCLDLIRRHLASTGICFANVDVRDREDRRWRDFPSKARLKPVYDAFVAEQGL